MKQSITAHIVVKNEDQWLYYALKSILPHADQILLCDTGSSDHTLDIIRSFSSPKIKFSQTNISSPDELTTLRNEQIKLTNTPWLWVVDGDEIYPEDTIAEIKSYLTDDCHGIAVRRYDLLGDVYHRQVETVGEYQLLGQKGHLVTRLINLRAFPGLHVARPYPLEAYLDNKNRVIHSYDISKWKVTHSYLYHAMYLKRSSLGSRLPMFNRSKYKIETGIPVTSPLPSVFSLSRPSYVSDPLARRSLTYELLAHMVTPIKKLKRKIV